MTMQEFDNKYEEITKNAVDTFHGIYSDTYTDADGNVAIYTDGGFTRQITIGNECYISSYPHEEIIKEIIKKKR